MLLGSVVVSGWGTKADWYRNILASPPIEVQTGGKRYAPSFRVVSPEEVYAVVVDYERQLPALVRPIARRIVRRLGFDIEGSEEKRRAHATSLLFVAFPPGSEQHEGGEREEEQAGGAVEPAQTAGGQAGPKHP